MTARYLLSAIFVFHSLCGMAQVVISGHAPGMSGKIIKAVRYAEQILYTEEEVALAKVGPTGEFTLSLNLPGTAGIFLDLDGNRKVLYVDKNEKYRVEYPSGKDKNGAPLPLKIITEGHAKLNQRIREFDQKYMAFRDKNIALFRTGQGPSIIASFLREVKAESAKAGHPYLSAYMLYETAELSLLSGKSLLSPIREYFTGKPVQAEHLSYMYAFNNIMAEYLPEKLMRKSGKGLWSSLFDKNLRGFLDTLGKDTLIGRGELRDWVALKGFTSLFALPRSDKRIVLGMIDQMAGLRKGKTVGKAARLVYDHLNRSVPGTPLPKVSLFSASGQKGALHDGSKKPTYIMFWVSTSAICLNELEALRVYHKNYGEKIRFVAVSLDASKAVFEKTAQELNMPITLLFAEDQEDVARKFNLPVLPQYILADEQGIILQAPAPSPVEKLDEVFMPLLRKPK